MKTENKRAHALKAKGYRCTDRKFIEDAKEAQNRAAHYRSNGFYATVVPTKVVKMMPCLITTYSIWIKEKRKEKKHK